MNAVRIGAWFCSFVLMWMAVTYLPSWRECLVFGVCLGASVILNQVRGIHLVRDALMSQILGDGE